MSAIFGGAGNETDLVQSDYLSAEQTFSTDKNKPENAT